MTTDSHQAASDPWSEANGGLRGSLLLKLCAVAYACACLLNLAVQVLGPAQPGLDDPLFLAALVAWDATLFLMALAFLVTGITPIFSGMGVAVGLVAGLQAVLLLLDLAMGVKMPFPPAILSLARNMVLAWFAVHERKFLGDRIALILAAVAGLQFLRGLLRGMEVWPQLPSPLETLLMVLFMLVTAGAIFAVGRSLHFHENRWARQNSPRRHGLFADLEDDRRR